VPTAATPDIGARIRELRVARGLTLRALAREVGVSASLISQIETGKSQPSVSTLYAITTALKISIEDVFDAAEALAPPVITESPVRPATAPHNLLEALAAEHGRRLGPLIHPTQREGLELDSGVLWERLGHVPGTKVDFLRVTYAPGGTSSSNDGLMRHSGVEYGYLVSGELVLTLGFEDHRIRPGDAVSFESVTPHRYRNDGLEPAIGIWFVIDLDNAG